MKHVMLDLETLGTTADAVILSIGAVKFNLESNAISEDGFYASVSIDSNLMAGRIVSEDTLLWWMEQSREAREVFYEAKGSLDRALENLSDWFGDDDYCVWSNGADFDIPILAHAYAQLKMELPWRFYNTRCVRTYKSLPCASRVAKPVNDHNALRDAINQARYVQAIHAQLTQCSAAGGKKVAA